MTERFTYFQFRIKNCCDFLLYETNSLNLYVVFVEIFFLLCLF